MFFCGCMHTSTPEEKTLVIHTDNSIRSFDGSAFVLERGDFSNVIKLNAPENAVVSANIAIDFTEAHVGYYDLTTGQTVVMTTDDVVRQEHIGDATNIHDIAFISAEKAYITQYDAPDIIIFNPSTGKKTGEKISLASYAPVGASAPSMDAAMYYNGKVYIGLQKLVNFMPSGASCILVLDADADTVIKEIALETTNPQGMHRAGEKLYIACTGSWGTQDGGIEVIDLTNDTSMGTLCAESTLGGDVSNVLVVSDTKGYCVVAGADFANAVIPFDPSTGAIDSALGAVKNAAQLGLAYDGVHVYIGERGAPSGLIIIDPANNSLVSGPHWLGLPPNAITIVK